MSLWGDLIRGAQGLGTHLDPNYYFNLDKQNAAQNLAYSPNNQSFPTPSVSPQTLQSAFPQQTPTQPAPDQSGGTYSGSTGGTSGGTNLSPYISQVQGDQSGLQSLYNQLYGGINNQVTDQTNQLNNQYGQQFATADKSFAAGQAATNNAMYGRGIGDSSYNAAAQGQNQDIYNQDHANMVNAQQQGLGSIGKYAQTAKAGVAADQAANQYDLSQYQDVPSLQALHQQLGQHIAGLQQQLAGLGTNQQYLDTVNSIAPLQSQAATQLSQKLATLANSSAAPEAKDALMKGYISEAQLNSPDAKNYWTSYFNDLIKKQSAAPATASPAVQ